LVFTPFVIGASTYHEARGNANYGFQMSLSMPLDREAVSLCKAHARQKLSKERLDYELVRVLKCSEFFEIWLCHSPRVICLRPLRRRLALAQVRVGFPRFFWICFQS
jgi:hypothetical protein